MKKLLLFSVFLFSMTLAHAKPFPSFNDEGIKLILELNGKKYDIQNYTLSFYKYETDTTKSDKKDTEKSIASFYRSPYWQTSINFMMKASKMDQELLNWLISKKSNLKEGSLSVIDKETGKTLKKISFKDARPGAYTESGDEATYGGSDYYKNITFSIEMQDFTIKLN